MKKIYILVFILLYSCAKPTVVEVVQTGDELLNCTELKQEIEETNKILNSKIEIFTTSGPHKESDLCCAQHGPK